MKRVDDKILNEAARSYQVVKHRTEVAQRAADQAKEGVDRLGREIDQLSDELDNLLSQADALLDGDYDFLDEEVWLSMLRDRNDMTHIYDGEAAKRLVDKIIAEYIPAFIDFGENIKRIYG